MASKVSISNSALTKIGAGRITDLLEDKEEARAVNARFDDILQMLLESHPWNFAASRAALAQLVTTPDFEYDYQYQLPVDCLKVLDVYLPYSRWKIEGSKLLTNDSEVNIKYTKIITDMNDLSPLFKESFAYYIARDVCHGLTGEAGLETRMTQLAERFLRQAKMRDAQEGEPELEREVSWISRRRTSKMNEATA